MADGQLNIQAKLDINDLVKTAARYRQEVTRMGVITDQQGNVMSTAWTRMKQAATAYLSLDIARKIAETRGQFQSLQVAFETMLNSQEKAQKLMSEAVELAAKTPFSLEDVATGAKQLLAYGFAAEDITETLRRLGDVASALGLPMERLTYLYGTTATQGRLYARDMIQFTTSGIPVLQELAQMYGKTTEEINNMVTAGEVGFEDIRKVFEQMTNEGGQFYNLMGKTSTTISGKISNLADAIQVMFNNIGESNEGIINGAIDGAKWLVENYQSVINILKVLVATYGTYKAALIAVAAAERVSAIIVATKSILERTKMLTRATQAQILFNNAVKANPLGLLLSTITGVITAFATFSKKIKSSTDIINDLDKATNEYIDDSKKISSIISEYESLSNKTNRNATENERLTSVMKNLANMIPNIEARFNEYGQVISINSDKVKEFTDAQKEALKINLSAQIKEAEEAVKDLDRRMKEQQDIFQSGYYLTPQQTSIPGMAGAIVSGNKKIKASQEIINNAAEKFNELSNEKLRINQKIISAQKVLNELTEEENENVEESIKTFEEQLEQAQKNVSSLKDRLSDLRSGKVKSNDYNKDIEETLSQLKEAEKVVENLTGVTDAMRKQQERENQKRLETVKKINEELLSLEEQNQNSRIELMKEGTEKEIAQINLDYQRRIISIKENEKKILSLYDKNGIGDKMFKLFGSGNVDVLARPLIDAAELVKKGWEDAGEGIATVFSSQYGVEDMQGKIHEILITPILPDGSILSPEELEEYIDSTLNRAEDILSADTKGLVIKVDASIDGNDGELLHKLQEKFYDVPKYIIDNLAKLYSNATASRDKGIAEAYKKELDDLLKQYQDFDAKRRSIDDKYAKDKQTLESRRTTSNASEIDSAINELNYQKEEALKEIAMEFASRNEEFEIWMNQIATFSMEELQKRLREARALLGSLQIAGVGGDKLAEAIAKVVTLEKEIANQKKKTSTSPDKRSVKDWQELYKTLSKVDEQFKEIGDSIGGTAGELLSSAGSISTAILSMIDGIITLTTGSIKSVEGMSDAAAKAIKAVETASVILAIVSAALQVVTKIFSMFKGKSKAEKDSERLSKVTNKIAETNEIINNLIEKRIDLIKAATTAERNGLKLTTEEAIKAQQDLIQVQYSKLWKNEILGKKGKNNDLDVRDLGLATVEQLKDFLSGGQIAFKDGFTTLIELEKQGYSLTDADKWKSIVDEWDKLNEQADQLKETVSEINTGINFDEARDGLDDFLLSADTTFKDISDNFEDYMRQSILNVVKSDYLNKEMKEWYDQFDKMSKDGALSASDAETLREKYETIYNEAQNRIDELLNAAGVNLEGAVPNSQAGAISETITEETASVMMGIWRGQYDVTKNIHTELISLRSDYKAAISKSNDILDMIASNTGRTADNTDGIGTTLKSIDNRLKTLETNSNKKYTK